MDSDLELAIQLSLREQQIARFDGAEAEGLRKAFELRKAPEHAPELQNLVGEKLKALGGMKQQLMFLSDVSRTAKPSFPQIASYLPSLVLAVLQNHFKAFESLGAFGSLQSESVNSPAEVLVALKDTAFDFIETSLSSLPPTDVETLVMIPVIKSLSQAVASKAHEIVFVREKLSVVKALLAYASFRSAFGKCMQMDVILGQANGVRNIELQGVGNLFAGGPQFEAQVLPPGKDVASQDMHARLRALETQLKAMHTDMKEILFTLMKDKSVNDSVLAWMAFMLERSKDPRDKHRCTLSLLANLLAILLQLCEPFLGIGAKAHQGFARFDHLWFLKKHRCDITGELKLGHSTAALADPSSSSSFSSSFSSSSNAAPAGANADLGFEIDSDEAAALADAIRMSLETSEAPPTSASASASSSSATSTTAASTSASATVAIPESFHFVTDVFFLTLRAVRIGFVPLLDDFHHFEQAFHDFVRKNQAPGVDLRDNPQFQQLDARRIDFLAVLNSETLLVSLSRLAVLTATWIQSVFATLPQPGGVQAVQAFADAVPEHIVRNIGTVLRHIIRFSPDILGATEGLQQAFVFLVSVLNAPAETVRNPIVRQELADVLLDLVQAMQQGAPEQRRSAERILNIVYGLRETQATLGPALIRLYINVSYVESQVEVFDKNSARYKLSVVLQEACLIQAFRKTVHDFAAADPDFAKFAGEVLSDATFLLDDALGRLADVKGMQVTMADKAAWDAKPEAEKADGIAYLAQVERTATSFLRMAVKSVEFLLFFASDPLLRPHFVHGKKTTSRLTATLLNFLDKLCGERTKELKVATPEKYGWNPRDLLQRVCEVTAQFCQEPGFATTLVSAADDTTRFRQAHHILTTKCRPSYIVTQAFDALVAEADRADGSNCSNSMLVDGVAQLSTTSSTMTQSPTSSASLMSAVPSQDSMDVSADGVGVGAEGIVPGASASAASSSSDPYRSWCAEEDEKDVDLHVCEAEYRRALFPYLNTDARLSDVPECVVAPAEKKRKSSEQGSMSEGEEEEEEENEEDEGPRTYSRHHYGTNISQSSGIVKAKMARLLQENKSLAPDTTAMKCSLPLHPGASIFLCRDEDRMDVYSVLLTGPVGTPYACGLFEFHVFIPDAYPDVPPLINLETTGGNQVRFNPNLYSCGKVCLSLLGTWHGGQKTDGWNKNGSTLLQVLVSIQSLIMVEHPYFNEPGYESQLGTEQGMRNSSRYNFERIVANIKHAMIGQIRNPPPGFKHVVRTHFAVLGDAIIAQCQKWARRAHAFARKHPGEYDWSGDIEKQTRILSQELANLRAGK